jgi:GntR family transcriptional regulator / MocR family aminotransferase
MPKRVTATEFTLNPRSSDQTLADWLYRELRGAILEGRLPPGVRLPASRDFAQQHGVSRGTVVNVFERLQAEGYLKSLVGSGTRVNSAAEHATQVHQPAISQPPEYVQQLQASYSRPKALAGLTQPKGSRPFQMRDGDVREFPARIWASLMARRARQVSSWIGTEDDGRGYAPLREAVAEYLATSRGIRCTPDQVAIVSGVQQALDLLARFLLKPGDPVWMEDPGYFGAVLAFGNAKASLVPVPVDSEGLSVSAGRDRCRQARGAYVTPAHQFPLGMAMSLDRRLQLLEWAAQNGSFVIEDDYDSEYRFLGRPIPALQSLDRGSHVIVTGSFNKLLFPSLRLGYIVFPECLVDLFRAFRFRTDLRSLHLDQAVLCDFITGGHLGRHLRRMRELYASRLEALIDASRREIGGCLEISGIQAGLYTAAFLHNGMTSQMAEAAATSQGLEVMSLDRFTIDVPDPRGILLGFAAFDESAIRAGVTNLARGLAR